MNSFVIRQKFLDYFKKNGHTVISSSSLIPAQDPTLLFANAGMNQFKDVFLGKEKRSYVRAASSQKCVRAGGKHNDLDQVGFTKRHLTFFEMLGNFSFGDYFKEEAIKYAWNFITEDLGISKDKLYVTVFREDQESYDLWQKIAKLPPERIVRLGEKDNFWAMGDTGPCGPCTEIYVDRGKDIGCGSTSCAPGCDCERFTEIWNNVFMQFNRELNGKLIPLKQTGVDTGMGLERLTMVLNNKDSVFETDLFSTTHKKIEQLTGVKYESSSKDIKAAFHVLSDHVRSCAFIIADGGTPSNEGRGYVLRKIIRRAALFSQKLSSDSMLFPKLANELILYMAPVYPELKANEALIIKLLTSEVERFYNNLLNGQAIIKSYMEDNLKSNNRVLSGAQVFKLYDTYGFPPEITSIIAQENNFTVDFAGFENEMQKQQEQSGKKKPEFKDEFLVPDNVVTQFVGYETLEDESKILWTSVEDNFAWIVTERSPFYVESGGQVNDEGFVSINKISYPVVDLKKVNKSILVKIILKEPVEIKVGTIAHSVVNNNARLDTVRNHTATHLLQAALMQLLGKSVKQAGSVVTKDYLRFDYTYSEPITKEQIVAIESVINAKIVENIKTKIYTTTLEVAKGAGVISFFGEKYNPENVRVVEVPGFSAELCGGTHASSTGIIGCFKIVSDASLSAGVRRIFAVTGPAAVTLFGQSYDIVKKLGENFKCKPEQILDSVKRVQDNLLEVQSELKQLRKQQLKLQIPKWVSEIAPVKNLPFIFLQLHNVENEDMKFIAQEIEKQKPGFCFLTIILDGRLNYVAYLSKAFEKNIDLKLLGKYLSDLGLRGGGSTTLVQGSGAQMDGLKEKIVSWLENHV